MTPLPLARSLSLDVGVIHFVGIGGIGMSGIAELLHNLGYRVQGSDLADNANAQRLRGMGIHIEIGHKADNLGEAAVVVISSAVKASNPEVVEARKRFIPVVRRAEMLAELMRLKISIAVAGTHGKTTTTSMLAALLEAGSFDPTVVNGGIINAYGTNAHLGKSDWMVVEADESDGSFTRLPATIAVVTNIEAEHLDHYGSFEQVRLAFQQFLTNLPFYGFAVLCLDNNEVQALISRVTDRRIVTYGLSPQADVRAVNVELGAEGASFDVEISGRFREKVESIQGVKLPMYGMHNVRNALAAIAVAMELHIPHSVILRGFAGFGGVKRRFTRTGTVKGIAIIDDYAHHPTELVATISAARSALSGTQGRVIAIHQPHRYSRLHDLFDEFCTAFNEADEVIIADVYAAGEEPIEGASRDHLIEGLRASGHKSVHALDKPEDLAEKVADIAREGDLVLCMGAGSITYWAHSLPKELEAEFDSRSKRRA